MKKLLFLLAACFLPLCGCAREVSPVSALALDKTADSYKLTVEIVRQDSLDDTAQPSYLAVTAPSMPELLSAMEHVLGNELFLSQADVLLIDEATAKDGILPIADFLCAEDDVRLSLRVVVVRDNAAQAVMKANDEVFALRDLLDLATAQGTLPDMPLYRVTEALHADGTAILPALSIDPFDQVTPAGTAVFQNEQLSCFLDGTEDGLDA